MRWDKRIYALYKGETNLADGTILEIAERTGKSIASIRYMTFPIYNKRANNSENRLIMVYLEDTE